MPDLSLNAPRLVTPGGPAAKFTEAVPTATLLATVAAAQNVVLRLVAAVGTPTLGFTTADARLHARSAARAVVQLLDHVDRDGSVRRAASAHGKQLRGLRG